MFRARVWAAARRLAVLALAVFVVLVLATKAAHAAGLIQEDIGSHPWIVAIVGILGIGPVAVVLTAIFDKAAAAVGISTSALLWMVCLALAIIIGLWSGDLPSWTGDPAAFYAALMPLVVKYRIGAETLHALFLGRLGWIKGLRAPKAAGESAGMVKAGAKI